MTYIPDEPKMVYWPKDGKDEKTSESFPEKPNTIPLLASGLGGLAGLWRKFKK
jgi:hypothetical protein